MAENESFDLHNQVSVKELDALMRSILENLWPSATPALAEAIPPLMVWGAPGLGKSTVIREMAKSFGVGFIDIRLAQREPIDIRGLPVPKENGVEWLVSAEWPRDPKSKGIILFDELTAADRSLQVAAYEFILDRRLGNLYSVPPGWYICAAGNRVEDRAVATTMSSALANRFLHVELQSNMEDWIAWALAHDVHPSVSGFIRFRPQMLFSQQNENLERGWPSPRSWERVSTMLKLLPADHPELLRHAVYGLVGNQAGVEFMAFHQLNVEGEDVLGWMLDPEKKIVIPGKADRKYAICAATSYHLLHGKGEAESKRLLDGFFRISLALPSDFAAMLMMDVISISPATAEKIYHHADYNEWTKRHGTALRRTR